MNWFAPPARLREDRGVHAGGRILDAGLDPTVGYLHALRPGRYALVFDLMEPLRPSVEWGVLALIREHTFSSGDVFQTERGVCRLHPQLARTVTGLAESDEGAVCAERAGAGMRERADRCGQG